MKPLLRAAALALGLGLGGCASLAPQPSAPGEDAGARAAWLAHRDALSGISAFTLDGRAANSLGVKADLHWQQYADGHFEVRIAGPLGSGATALSGTAQRVLIRSAQGEELSDDPEAWLQAHAGWSLPLRGLRWWALGLPAPDAPAQTQLDAQGRLAILQQQGWTLSYNEYTEVDGLALPRRLEASNTQLRVKLLIDRWQDVLKSAPADGH
ncbi:outer membrane lipoprotein LolB [Solimonas aquatica]|uniref:Outer-membrane lipoprotein LolB n=1 Tax=Solimonas aquatica TaxID=489703 RepID=A0A1H9DSU7_9GAMM|nr:lipoprotein insertase outer membrane protein LolB [Solimonas aquatica]SEQ15833.1 outer membrane lipoprotein LolB [Solimonas aquatica]